MEQKTIAKWLKIMIAGLAVCGLAVYAAVIPECGRSITAAYPEFSGWYMPWLIFLWATALPCYAALILGWRIAGRIGLDRSFTHENARELKLIAYLTAGDAVFFFLGNIVLMFCGMNHPGVLLASLMVTFVGFAVAVAAAALSHLVKKAADLQEQSDLTI